MNPSDTDLFGREFYSMKIYIRILLIAALPTIGAILFGSGIAWNAAEVERGARTVSSISQMLVRAGAVVHELQKERGMSATFLVSKGKTFRTELAAQRIQTDRVLGDLRAIVSSLDLGGLEV